MGNGVAVVTQPPCEGGPINKNIAHTFNIHVHGGYQPEIDNHQDVFFMPKDDSVYDAYGSSPAEVDRKFRILEEKLKAIEGSGAFGLDIADTCLLPGVKIPAKFQIPDFEK